MTELEDIYDTLSDEDLKDHWNGEGHLIFHVLSHDKNRNFEPFEIEWDDYSGCVGGLNDTLGIEHAVNEGILDVGKLRIGMTYEIQGISVYWTRGDGWTTDDDVEYEIESVNQIFYLHRFIKAWWWHLIGWRIRK